MPTACDAGGYGYPALVALYPSKEVYVPHKGGFSLDSVRSFIENLRRGFEKATRLQGRLAQVRSISPWDGSDAAVVEEEEEFSLDDIMGDDMPVAEE